ncbi:MAG TPA: ABC transporter substrate-binding protein [Chthoniobacterales bacterium]
MRGLKPGWLLAVIAGNMLSACSPSKPTGDDGDSGHSAGNPPSAYVEQEAGKPGGTLNVVSPRDLSTIDLQRTGGPRNGWYGRILFDCLVYLDEQGRIQPWLAKSWTVSPDGKTYTFHLRDDVSFSDGTKFNAEAARINLARIRDPATKAAVTTSYIEPYIDGKVIDEYTFQANLRERHEPFLHVLALSIFGMYSPKQIIEAPQTLTEAPIGSGPFVIEKYKRQEGISFVRRKDYHWAPPYIRHKGPAYLDRIDVKFVPEAIVSASALQSGQFDMSVDAQPQLATSIRGNSDFVFSSRILRGNPSQGPVFNTQKEPFSDLRLRLAFAYAVDREGLVQMKGFGALPVKTDYLSSKTEHYDPTCDGALRYDPAAANRLLDEAGWTGRDKEGYRTKDGKRLTAEVLLSAATATADIPAIQSDVKKVGIEITIAQLPPLDLAARRYNGNYQMLGALSLHTNTPDALYIFFHSSQIPSDTQISSNSSRLRDSQLDELLAKARGSNDPALLKELYSKAQHRLLELVPSVPLNENTVIVAYNKNRIKGVIYDTSHDLPFLIAAWLNVKKL